MLLLAGMRVHLHQEAHDHFEHVARCDDRNVNRRDGHSSIFLLVTTQMLL